MNHQKMTTGPSKPKDAFVLRADRLSPALVRLGKNGRHRVFQKGEKLCAAGDIPTNAYIILRGRVECYEYSEKGEERIYTFNEANSIILEPNVLFQYESPVGFRASEETTVIALNRSLLQQAVQNDGDIALALLEASNQKLMLNMELFRRATTYTALYKVCDMLLTFASFYGEPYDGKTLIRTNLSQQLISGMLGINRLTVLRIIKKLKNAGLIEQINGYYCIRDLRRLEYYRDHENRLM